MTTENAFPCGSQQTANVMAQIQAFVVRHALTSPQLLLLQTALCGLQAQIDDTTTGGQLPVFLQLPLRVYAALTGDPAPAIPLAGACSLLFLGLDIFDDLADGDLPAHWNGYAPSQINLTAATLLCALPQLAIAELDAPPAIIAAMQQTVAQGLLRMSAGQQQDLDGTGQADITSAQVETSVAGKSGAEMAMFASLAALLAGANEAQVIQFADMGTALGSAGQFASDCYDVFFAPYSKDLANGTRTLPIVTHWERLTGRKRFDFLALLERVQTDADSVGQVRRELHEARILSRCAFIVETHCQRALRHMRQACPSSWHRTSLEQLIAGLSFFRPATQQTK